MPWPHDLRCPVEPNASTRRSFNHRSTSTGSKRTSRPSFKYGMRRSSTSRRTKRLVTPRRAANPSTSSSDPRPPVRSSWHRHAIQRSSNRPLGTMLNKSRPDSCQARPLGTSVVHRQRQRPSLIVPGRASELHVPWWRGQDLNLRPSGYEPDELPDCSTPRRGGGTRLPEGRFGSQRPSMPFFRRTAPPDPRVAQLTTEVATLQARLTELESRLRAADARLDEVSSALTSQLHELSGELESSHRSVDQRVNALDSLTAGRLAAAEKAQEERLGAFRAELEALMADHGNGDGVTDDAATRRRDSRSCSSARRASPTRWPGTRSPSSRSWRRWPTASAATRPVAERSSAPTRSPSSTDRPPPGPSSSAPPSPGCRSRSTPPGRRGCTPRSTWTGTCRDRRP